MRAGDRVTHVNNRGGVFGEVVAVLGDGMVDVRWESTGLGFERESSLEVVARRARA